MKMSIEEFKQRLSAGGSDGAIAIVEDGRVVGHYLPASTGRDDGVDIAAWAEARERFRRKWIARTPDWKERLERYGLDEEGEPFDIELPRFPA